MSAYVRVLEGLARSGPLGRELGVRLDLMRSLGPRWAWRRVRAEAAYGRHLNARESTYASLWRDAAAAVGAEVVDLSGGFLEIRRGASRTRVWQQFVMLDDGVTLRLALEKAIVYRLLAAEGLRVPEHLEFGPRELDLAERFLLASPGPCVVKPVSGTSGGSGATAGVRTRGQLVRASLRAGRISRRLSIERQAPGSVFRLLFLEGRLLDVVERRPPRVVGDGRTSIGDLVTAENQRRLEAGGDALPLLRVDLDCLFTLENQGLALGSVPADGETVAVKTVTNQNGRQDNETLREEIADEVRREAALAAAVVGVRLAGVDIVAPDLRRPLRESGGVIIEVNGGPGLHHHTRVADPAGATPVAREILEHVLAAAS